MCKNTRLVVIALLAAMVLSTGLSGCSLSVEKEFGAEWSFGETAEPTARPATATAAPRAATPAPTRAAPTPTPTLTPSPTPSTPTAQTITQDIVIHHVSDDGVISAETTFTMTASIQVGMVNGINMTAEPVPMPEGAVPYDPAELPIMGDVVRSADDMIVQVHGWETVDPGGEMQLVLVDVTIGNAGEERQLVATYPCMEIVSGDGHWYSASSLSMFWLATLGEEEAKARTEGLLDTYLENGITSDFAVALDPGQAARGTAVFPVPKSATELAFGFQSYYASTYLLFLNEALPTIFVPLGLEGQFPEISWGVEPVEGGATYQVGDSFEAVERGVSFQVQSAWARQESPVYMWELGPGEQFVVVHVIAPASGGAGPLDKVRELALVDGQGNAFELLEYAADWLTHPLGAYNQRGVLVYKGPRDASGLELHFTPLDPATLESDSPEPLKSEAAIIELGEVEAAPAVVVQRPDGRPEPTQEPKPTGDGTSYELGDQIEVGGLAITVSGWGVDSGPEGFEAGEGNVWVTAYVTLENVGSAAVEVYPESFAFVDQTGVVYDNLLNKPSSWDEIRNDVIEYVQLAPGDMLEDRIVAIEIAEAATPGLKLRYTAADGSEFVWDLGL